MTTSTFTIQDKHVLIIDDVYSARLVLSDMLKEIGFELCLEASNGREALSLLEKHRVHLIFCDFMMGGMDGLEFLRELKRAASRPPPSVIFVSAMGDEQSVNQALQLGACDYLVKPLRFNKLREKVKTALVALGPATQM